jgi:hypothetical protein
MAVVVGVVLVGAGAAVAVVQGHWATGSGVGPLRMWHVSESLPARRRHLSDAAIPVLLLAGASIWSWTQPVWLQFLALGGAAAVTAAAQALALRSARDHPVHSGA